MTPKRPSPSRREWRFREGVIIHEPRLWLPYLAIRFDGVKLGAFPTYRAAEEMLHAGAGVVGMGEVMG